MELLLRCAFYVLLLFPCLARSRPNVYSQVNDVTAYLRTLRETYTEEDEYPDDLVIGAYTDSSEEVLFHLLLRINKKLQPSSEGRLYTNVDQSTFLLKHLQPGCFTLQGVIDNGVRQVELKSRHHSNHIISKETGVKHRIRTYLSAYDEDMERRKDSTRISDEEDEEDEDDEDDDGEHGVNMNIDKYWRRMKRASTQYTVKLLMVVDYAIYSRWNKYVGDVGDKDTKVTDAVTDYYDHIFNGVDTRFNSINKQPYKIHLALAGLVIAKTEPESDWTMTSALDGEVSGSRLLVNASEALEKFQMWLDSTADLPAFDHAILFTGTDLSYAGSAGNTGLAFAESMCRNISNSSIVEDSFDFRTITFATQQLARSLGARDDMDNNDCLEFFNYIMSPKLKLPVRSFPSNRWKFSTCSELYFKDYISNLDENGGNCLLDTAEVPVDMPAPMPDLPGKEYTAAQQCRLRFGLESDICRIQIGPYYSKLCTGLLCLDPQSRSGCSYILPADGTPCGNMKYCLGGKCSEFEDASPSTDSCVFGNDPESNCDERIYRKPSLCYNDTIRYSCCRTCEYMTINLTGCEYGDRGESCAVSECGLGDPTYVTDTCCLTCVEDPTLYVTPARIIPTSPVATTSQQPELQDNTTLSISSTQSTSISDISQSSESIFNSSTSSGLETTSTPFTAAVDGNETTTLLALSDTTSVVDSKTISETESNWLSETTVTTTTKGVTMHSRVITSSNPSVQSEAQITTVSGEMTSISKFTGSKPKTQTSTVPMTKVTSFDRMTRTTQSDDSTTTAMDKSPIHDATTVTPGLPSNAEPTRHPTTALPCTDVAIKMTNPPPTTTTTPPAKTKPCKGTPRPYIPEKAMSVQDRIFFKELAKSMRQNQRRIRQETQYHVRLLYRAISLQIQNYQESDNESVFFTGRRGRGEAPSNDDDDLNRLLRPLWLAQHRQLVQNLEMTIKQMRYRVLALVNRHLRK